MDLVKSVPSPNLTLDRAKVSHTEPDESRAVTLYNSNRAAQTSFITVRLFHRSCCAAFGLDGESYCPRKLFMVTRRQLIVMMMSEMSEDVRMFRQAATAGDNAL